jgi:hypothetical protein
MDEITMTLPMYFQLFSASFLCAICAFPWALVSTYAVVWMKGATAKKAPKPKGLNDD